MPSAEFMASVLGSDAAAAARGEIEVEESPPEVQPEEQPYEDPEGDDEPEEQGEQQETQEPPEGDEQEAEEEPQGEAAYGAWDEEFETPEAMWDAYQRAQKQERDNRAWGQEQSRARAALEREMMEARELLAYTAGSMEQAERNQDGQRPAATSSEYREWVEEMVEAGQPEAGLYQVRQYGEETGDWSYALKYTDIWAEDDPYRAAKEGAIVELAASLQRSRMAQQEPEEEYTGQAYDMQAASQVIDQARTFLTQHYPDLRVGSPVLNGTVEVIKEDIRLHEMLRSGDFENVTWAIEVARDRFLARQPRRARASRQARETVDAEKTALPQGDGIRMNGRRQAVPGNVPDEVAAMMGQFRQWGMVRGD